MIIDDFKLWLKSNEERILQQGLRLVDVYKNITEKEIEKSVVYIYENFKYISQLTIRNDGYINIELLQKDSEEMVFYMYCKTDKKIMFESLFDNYLYYISQN